MTDKPKTCLTDGSPITPDHREIERETGMQKGYVVLCPEERAKGFIRPVRQTYVHVGERPKYPTRELTDEEKERNKGYHTDYVLYEIYPESESPATGRYWTQEQLESGCGSKTTMGLALAETYARDPKFYGATFCVFCHAHFPVAEFVWDHSDERVGS